VSVFAVSVFAAAVALGVAATGLSEPACAASDQTARVPKVRTPPASKLSVVARACATRINIALSALLVTVTVCSLCGS
jgi:hypothetical protein